MWQRLIVIAGIGVALLLAAGCKGGGSLSLDEYLQRLEDVGEEADRKGEDIESPSVDDYDNEPDYLDAVAEERRERFRLIEDSVDEFKSLKPPSEAKDAHDRYLDSFGHILSAFDDLIEGLEASSSIDEANEVVDRLNAGGSELSNALEDGRDACRDLQGLADDNDINVDLKCAE
jgi:hypothetical protein